MPSSHPGQARAPVLHLFPLIFIVLVVATLFAAPLARDEVFTLRDHTDYFQPLRWFTAEQLREGKLPLWNPYSASGEPWLANPQTGVFYPPTWLFVALPFARAYMLYLALHMAILGCGAYALFARNAAPGAALAGAVALMLCGPTLSFLDISNNFASFAWIPLVVACALERRSDAPRWSIALDAVAIACAFLGGEPFLAAFAAAMYAVIVVRRDRLRASLVSIAIAGGGAFALTAAQLLPFLESLAGSDRRAGLSTSEIFREPMPLRDWPRIAIRPDIHPVVFDPALGQHFIPIIYVGFAVALLALAGCFVARARPWLIVVAIAMITGTGPSLLAHLPLTLFRYPSRMLPLGTIAIVALAVAGWDRIRPKQRWADLVLVAVIAVDLLTVVKPLLGTAPFDPHSVPYPRAIGAAQKLVRIGDADVLPTERRAWIGGYLNLYDHRFDAWTAAPVISQRYTDLYAVMLTSRDFALADAFAVGWVLSARPSMTLPRFAAAARARGITVYAVREARPLARLRTNDGREWPVESLALDVSSATVRVNAPREGLVVLAQQDAPGWRVFVDGKEVAKRLDRGILRAALVPAGPHEVVWRYRPRTLSAGLLLTLGALVSMLFALVLSMPFVKQRAHKKIFRGAR